MRRITHTGAKDTEEMNGVTIVWSMVAAACVTLAGIHLPVWARNRAPGPASSSR